MSQISVFMLGKLSEVQCTINSWIWYQSCQKLCWTPFILSNLCLLDIMWGPVPWDAAAIWARMLLHNRFRAYTVGFFHKELPPTAFSICVNDIKAPVTDISRIINLALCETAWQRLSLSAVSQTCAICVASLVSLVSDSVMPVFQNRTGSRTDS